MASLGKRQTVTISQEARNRIAKEGIRPAEWLEQTKSQRRVGLWQDLVLDYRVLDTVLVFKKLLDPGRLAESLSATLAWYPWLAGRLNNGVDSPIEGLTKKERQQAETLAANAKTGKWVDHNNKGVSFVLATMENVGWPDLVDSATIQYSTGGGAGHRDNLMNFKDYCDLEPEMAKRMLSGIAPLVTVQLTKLQRGGCALGVAMSQAVADAESFRMFLQDWSLVYQEGGRLLEPVAFLPDSMVLPQRLSSQLMREAMQRLGLMKLEPGLSQQLIKESKAALAAAAAHSGKRVERPPHVRLTLSRFHRDTLQHGAQQELGKRGTREVTIQEAVIVHIWRLLLDTCDFSRSERKHLSLLLKVDPRQFLDPRQFDVRTFGSATLGVPMAVDMSGENIGVMDAFHHACDAVLTNEYVAAVLQLDPHMFPDDQASGRVLFNPMVSTEQPGCLPEVWMCSVPLGTDAVATERAQEAYAQSGQVNAFQPSLLTFGVDLVRSETCYNGEAMKICERVDGGVDIYLSAVPKAFFNAWPQVTKKFPGPGSFIAEVLKRHNEWRDRLQPPRRSAFNFAMGHHG
ncbi:unnamed protein product [Amoebophrya sp. A25]|nr:unnamed protein product [Amoebophrya sp. A25]|eukprot:GSA25T00021572001.1